MNLNHQKYASYLALEELGGTIEATAEMVVAIVATAGVAALIFFKIADLFLTAAAEGAALAAAALVRADSELPVTD